MNYVRPSVRPLLLIAQYPRGKSYTPRRYARNAFACCLPIPTFAWLSDPLEDFVGMDVIIIYKYKGRGKHLFPLPYSIWNFNHAYVFRLKVEQN